MDGPINWWWKMNLLNVCVQAGFCQIRSHLQVLKHECIYASGIESKGSLQPSLMQLMRSGFNLSS